MQVCYIALWKNNFPIFQYFSPVTIATGQNKEHFRWLPREVIEERGPDTSVLEDTVQKFTATGEAVGGVVQGYYYFLLNNFYLT